MKLAESLRSIFKAAFIAILSLDAFDVVALFGLGLVTAGVTIIYAPLGLIVPGVVFFLVGVRARHGS